MKRMKNEYLNIKIEKDLKDALLKRAKEEGRDLSNLVRNIIERDMIRKTSTATEQAPEDTLESLCV